MPPTAEAPPFRLPGTHFAGAVVWLVLGGLGLVAVSPALAAGDFLSPRVLAVTHLFTLGVITASIFGALYQFYPMSLGAAARSVRVGVAGAWLMHAGVALLVSGLWLWMPALQAAGWVLLFGSIGCIGWNLLPHRRRMTHGRRVGAYVSAAHSLLGFALFIAGARIGASLGWWTLDRPGAIAAHFHLGAFGFAGLTAVGVGSRMLPMFLVAGRAPDWPVRFIGPVATGGLLVLATGLLTGFGPAVWAGALLGVAAAALFMWLVAGFFRHRLIRRLEPAFGHVVAGFAFLVMAIGTGLTQLATPGFSPRGWTVYAELTLLGWLVVFITGIWYRLFAFLIWLHFHGRQDGSRARTAAEIVNRPVAWLALGLLAPGVGVLAIGTALGAAGVARAGAVGILMAAVLIAGQYGRMFVER
jgi:hypothetical protein